MNIPGYESLSNVLQRAYAQAALGKGAERHAGARPFSEQPMQSISDLLGSHDGLLYQAMKKVQESKRLDKDAGVRELLGAINYLAGAVIFIEARRAPVEQAEPGRIMSEQVSAAAMDALRFARPTHYTCCAGHPDTQVPVGQKCPQCDPQTRKVVERVTNPATGLATHWVCSHGTDDPARKVPVGEACPFCYATT